MQLWLWVTMGSCGSLTERLARPSHGCTHDLAAMAQIGVGDWLMFSAGIGIGALTIAAAILIAWRQRVIQVRDRAAERAAECEREEALRRERDEHDAKVARRDVWRAEYEEIRKLLERAEVIEYRVRNDGPLTAAGFSALDVGRFKMNAEQLAERGVEQLRDPLLRLATLADELTHVAVPEETVVTPASAQGSISDHHLRVHHAQRLAVLQDRGARALADQISRAWQILRTEWGSRT